LTTCAVFSAPVMAAEARSARPFAVATDELVSPAALASAFSAGTLGLAAL
jgi:hypothetical protein